MTGGFVARVSGDVRFTESAGEILPANAGHFCGSSLRFCPAAYVMSGPSLGQLSSSAPSRPVLKILPRGSIPFAFDRPCSLLKSPQLNVNTCGRGVRGRADGDRGIRVVRGNAGIEKMLKRRAARIYALVRKNAGEQLA
jgi:hypothetical protein